MTPLHAQEAAQKRVALVIGNGAYENAPGLNNPKNDAADVAAALSDVGFGVLLQTDLSQSVMLDTLRSFRRSADGAEIALIYFAGHGIEIDRQNYLLPVDAVLERDTDINFEAVKLETMIFAASGAARLSMIIVDACRDNPFATSMKRGNASRSIGQGLRAVEPTRNTLVAYAAKEGTVAFDGTGRNSPYANALIASLREPGLEVGLMMRRVRDDVLKTTGGKQEPFVYGSLSADQIFLNDTRNPPSGPPEIVSTDGALVDVPQASASEILFWKSISETSEVADLKAYLELYPDGFFAETARARLREAEDAVPRGEAIASVEPERVPSVQVQKAEETRALTRAELVELQQRLSVLGHELGRADGIAGSRTEAAIRAFETSENMAVAGLATVVVLEVLRERVSETELKSWQAKQAARVQPKKTTPTRPKTAAKPKTTTKPAATAKKPSAPPKQTTTTVKKPDAKYKQFCASNRQCATSECRVGNSGLSWRNTRACKICTLFVKRCQ